MKAIVIQQTCNKTGFTASVVGMKNYQAIAKDEITALKHLVEKLEQNNQKFIISPDYAPTNPDKQTEDITNDK